LTAGPSRLYDQGCGRRPPEDAIGKLKQDFFVVSTEQEDHLTRHC
jgi:hypothetical protein